jgi:protein tyrosine phosphatase (PTP) superfamily phosphohydrolase (DUF442 family)
MDSDELRQIHAFHRLTEKIATAGQPRREHFALIARHGYEIVVNLSARPEWPECLPIEKSVPDEAELVAGAGMQYVWQPIHFWKPVPADVDTFFETVRANRERKLFVHCAGNCRVSALFCAYRILFDGQSAEQAKHDTDQFWTLATGKPLDQHEIWTTLIDETLERYRSRRSAAGLEASS